VWTGAWYHRTLRKERVRLGTNNVKLLVVSLFIDETHLDNLGRTCAVPIMSTLLNYTLEILASDKSKKLWGFYPDVHLSNTQQQDPAVKKFMRELNSHVTDTFIKEMADLYQAGGRPFVDSEGAEWQIVPVLSFVVADMKEARVMKGVYNTWKCIMPCHMCEITFNECDHILEPADIAYRGGDEMTEDIKRWLEEIR